MNANKVHELVIIGAGPGGYRAAFMASDLGLDVSLVDPEVNPGGICLYRGCIPTKTLLHLVKTRNEAAKAGDKGMKFSEPEIDIDNIRKWKEGVVSKLTGGLGQLVKSRKINYIKGYAKFTGDNSLELKKENGDKETIKFKNAIIATGVVPREVPGIDNDMPGIMNSSAALELEDVPEKLLVIGGGYIGIETGTIYHSFGSEVTITELTGNIMPGMDEDLLAEYKKSGGQIFSDIFLETKVEGIKKKGKKLEVQFNSKEKGSFTGSFDKVLAAIGQVPRTKHLGLENAGVKTNSDGFIRVDEKQQTSIKNIYAIGDIAGPPLLAHKASYEGMIAAEAIAGKDVINDARAIPMIVYTEPEIATCGLNEIRAKEEDIPYKTSKFSWKASGRAMAMGEDHGFTKLLIHPETDAVLGAGIVGTNAGDLLPEIALAIEMAATAKDLALTIHPHPSLSETIMEAAELYYGNPVHIYKKKRK